MTNPTRKPRHAAVAYRAWTLHADLEKALAFSADSAKERLPTLYFHNPELVKVFAANLSSLIDRAYEDDAAAVLQLCELLSFDDLKKEYEDEKEAARAAFVAKQSARRAGPR